jgi:hypothetical protein
MNIIGPVRLEHNQKQGEAASACIYLTWNLNPLEDCAKSGHHRIKYQNPDTHDVQINYAIGEYTDS